MALFLYPIWPLHQGLAAAALTSPLQIWGRDLSCHGFHQKSQNTIKTSGEVNYFQEPRGGRSPPPAHSFPILLMRVGRFHIQP